MEGNGGNRAPDTVWELVHVPEASVLQESDSAAAAAARCSLEHSPNRSKDVVEENVKNVSFAEEAITKEEIERFRREFETNSSNKITQNACVSHSIHSLTLSRDLIQSSDGFTFSTAMRSLPVTNQRSSGRCWLFATLNVFRYAAVEKLKVHNFEFSEAYLHFYDKLEKANAFLEAILETSHRPLRDRTVSALLDGPIGDGNDWTPAVSLMAKYGVVPKCVYPESYTSKSTSNMNASLKNLLLCTANELRNVLKNNKNDDGKKDAMEEARRHKNDRMADVYKILCIHLGTPPTQFDWQWRDEDGVFHREDAMTPLEFLQTVVDEDEIPYKTHVSLLHDPRHEYYRPYTYQYGQTVLGGLDIMFLNVPIEEMKKINQKMLEDHKPVYFACNVNSEFTEEPGLWDAELYDIEGFYRVQSFAMSKEDRIRFGSPMGTHAMIMTGVDVDCDGKPRRWKVENSWGVDGGHDGYYTMNDNWYDEYVFEIVAPPSYLTDEMKAGLTKEPTVLPAWDAMSLGRRFNWRR